MSSDAFRYRVESVAGRDVVLTIQPTTAGGLCDLAWSRSFVAMLLREQGGPLSFEQSMHESWLAANLDGLIERVVPERLVGVTHAGKLRDDSTMFCVPAEHLQPRLTVRATFATEALAAHFVVGQSQGTTAFDVWMNDPAHVPLTLVAEPAPKYDPVPAFASVVVEQLRARLPHWNWTSQRGLQYEGADATLRLHVTDDPWISYRSSVSVELTIEVPAFALFPAPKKNAEQRLFLLGAKLVDEGANHPLWFRRWRHVPETLRFELFASDAPPESMDSLVARLAATVSPSGLDRVLHRDGLRGLMEMGVRQLPKKRGESPWTKLGDWSEPEALKGWRWEWKHGQTWLPEPIWTRVALHAAFGTQEHARAALADAMARSKRAPVVYKPFLEQLQAGTLNAQ